MGYLHFRKYTLNVVVFSVAVFGAGCSGKSGNDACDPDPCNGRGTCETVGGEAQCTCEEAYGGQFCDACADGYQDNDGDDVCAPGCEIAQIDCADNAACDDGSGEAVCVCNPGHEGPDCDACADGYQDNDGDGVCHSTCAAAGYTCSDHGTCDDGHGEPVCICEPGYEYDGNGNCLLVHTGEDCTDPIPLPLATGVVNGDTTGASNQYQGSCVNEPNGDDRVYVVEVSVALHVLFQTDGFDTVLYLRAVCDNASDEIECNNDISRWFNHGSRIEADLQPGTYYLFVDGDDDAGPFTLSMVVDCGEGQIYDPAAGTCVDDPCDPNPCDGTSRTFCDPILPSGHQCLCDPGYVPDPNDPDGCILNDNAAGDTCADPIALAAPGEGVVNSTTVSSTNAATGSCGGLGSDQVYGITLTEPARVAARLTGFDGVLHMRTDCDFPLSEVGCNDESAVTGVSQLVRILEPGFYFLFADSYDLPGAYELTWSIRHDPCADDEAVCPGPPQCEPAFDWQSHECVCPDGQRVHGNDCVADPCIPNLCTDPDKNRCVADLPGSYHCECNVGYMDDTSNPGTCIPDPSAGEWTVLVFLNADNNLEYYGYLDLVEMELAGSTADVDIVVLFDSFTQDEGRSPLLYVNQGGSTEVADWTEADMSSWKTLRDFGVWAVTNHPARNYFLIVWDHGDGWKADIPSPLVKGFSSDENGSPGAISITTGDYARALRAITAARGERLEMVGFDACLMGMWEVAEATRPFARYLVASEETIPAEGWTYDGFLLPLTATPTLTATQLAHYVIDSYADESSYNATMSLIDLDTLDNLATALTGFADALAATPSMFQQFQDARGDTTRFGGHRDLWHFAENVAALSGAPQPLVDAANALIAHLGLSILYNRTRGTDYDNAHGLSIYLPRLGGPMDSDYLLPDAVWTPRSTWDEFLEAFTQ